MIPRARDLLLRVRGSFPEDLTEGVGDVLRDSLFSGSVATGIRYTGREQAVSM